MKGKWKERKLVVNVFLGVKNVWTGSKIKRLKDWKLRARKLTLHLINVAEINAQQN